MASMAVSQLAHAAPDCTFSVRDSVPVPSARAFLDGAGDTDQYRERLCLRVQERASEFCPKAVDNYLARGCDITLSPDPKYSRGALLDVPDSGLVTTTYFGRGRSAIEAKNEAARLQDEAAIIAIEDVTRFQNSCALAEGDPTSSLSIEIPQANDAREVRTGGARYYEIAVISSLSAYCTDSRADSTHLLREITVNLWESI